MALKKLVAGNWKMHGIVVRPCARSGDRGRVAQYSAVDVALCLPATLIERAARAVPGFAIGGQDVHFAEKGAHTGCISAQMLHRRRRAPDHRRPLRAARGAARKRRRGQRQGRGGAGCRARRHPLRRRKPRRCATRGEAVATVAGPARRLASRTSVGDQPSWRSPMSRSGRSAPARSPTTADIAEMHAAIRAAAGRRVWRCRRAGPHSLRRLGQGRQRGRNFAVADVDGALVGGASLNAADFVPDRRGRRAPV